MNAVLITIGILFISVVFWDAFETVILPRRVIRKVRLAGLFYRFTWRAWSKAAGLFSSPRNRENYLGYFGPLSLVMLIALWAFGIVLGFAFLQDAARNWSNSQAAGFWTDLYNSGTMFFTHGLHTDTPVTPLSRALTVIEAGTGFGFLALVIGYLPALNESFSRREVSISLLDERAGSPPTAAEMLRRHGGKFGIEALHELLYEWERWSAELMESHLSYPVLAYFRSQHDNQSWLAALTAILDTCSLVMAGVEGACERQARLTFAITRHAVVDLAHVFGREPSAAVPDRLPPSGMERLHAVLQEAGLKLRDREAAEVKLRDLRGMYEPFVYGLSELLLMPVPPFLPDAGREDNWLVTAWPAPPGAGVGKEKGRGHF